MNDNCNNNTMEDKLIGFIYEIEKDCDRLSQDIISRLCKRAIRKLNKFDSCLAGKTDDYPSSFKFCDVLSVELQSCCYEEINPFLRDFIDDTLYNEYNELPQTLSTCFRACCGVQCRLHHSQILQFQRQVVFGKIFLKHRKIDV